MTPQTRRARISSRTIIIGIICLALLGYIVFEARFLLSGPQLIISSPSNRSSTTTPVIEVRGTVANISKLAINNRQIMITPDGTFADKLLLLNGYNTIEVKANNKFGQENRQILEVVLLGNN